MHRRHHGGASAICDGQGCCGAGQHAGRELRVADQAVPGPGAGHARRQGQGAWQALQRADGRRSLPSPLPLASVAAPSLISVAALSVSCSLIGRHLSRARCCSRASSSCTTTGSTRSCSRASQRSLSGTTSPPDQGRAAERGGGALLVISSISLIVMPALRVVSPSQRCQHLVRTASQDRSIKSTPCEA